MKRHTEEAFLGWAEGRGLSLDPRYPRSAVLHYANGANEARFWPIPREPEVRPFFLFQLVDLMGEWSSCFAWRHLGRWPKQGDPERINDLVEHQILSGLKLPMGTTDVVEFGGSEIPALVTLLFSTTVFGWSVGEDLYVVPEHARMFLQTDHHDVVHAVFSDANEVESWVEAMTERGFPLPTEVPDVTFKQPDWMPSHDR